MSAVKTTLTGYLRYRGREGHWGFLLHRITGLGVGLFLTIHIADTAMVFYQPALYIEALKLYQSTLFGIAEIFLIFCIFYHGVNGLRVAYFDLFAPQKWEILTQRSLTRWTLGIALLLWIPAAGWMLRNLLIHNFGMFGG
jgi:succinate dehydrogenase / fumarate reductase, cytochrome b subunit